jgi:hypothetical protein
MREAGISIAPYQFLDLIELQIHKTINQHATVKVVGRIAESLENQYVDTADNQQGMIVKALDELGKEEVLFNGVVKSVAIKNSNDVRTLEVEAISGSYLMDLHPQNRTFQNEQQNYKSVLDSIIAPYPKSGIMMSVGASNPIKQVIVQYRETDWCFAKRLASHFNSFLSPDYKAGGIKFYFGMPELKEEILDNLVSYTTKKDVGEYLHKSKNKVAGVTENDALYYQVKSREILDLCQAVTFKGKKLFVYEIQSKLEGSVLMHYYSLKNEKGFKTKKEYNEKLIGASIDAKVLDVSKDTVKVHMSVDEKQDSSTAKWLPFSTVYSSPDGTGWYCMPESGDSMRVYYPDEKEENSFVISAVHEQSTTAGKRSDPNVKILSTKHGKEIIFSEKGLEIKSGDGLYIGLLDEEGIVIRSDKAIKIHSTEDMLIGSDKSLMMIAKEGIEFNQGDKTTIELKDDITFKGGQVKMAK